VGAKVQDFLLLAVAILAAVGCAYYYVLQPDRSRVLQEASVSAAVLFAVAVSVCAAVVATLLITTWRHEDLSLTTVVAFVLLPVLILAIMAWREAF
jgi:drug/metabolite transporter (DMT)-like permease